MKFWKFIIKWVTFLVLFVGLASTLQASHQEIKDSINAEKDADKRMRLIESYCLRYLNTEPLWTDTLTTLLMNDATANNDSFFQARALFFKGVRLTRRQKLQPAFETYTKARKIITALDSTKALAEILHNLGLVHFRLSEGEEARALIEEAKKINIEHDYVVQLIKNEMVLAVLEKTLEDRIASYKAIGKLSREKKYVEGEFLSTINVATLLNNSGQADSALYYLGLAEELRNSTGNDLYINNVYQLKGLIYNREEKYDLAEKYLLLALEANRKKDLKNRIVELYLNLSSVYGKKHEYKKAYEYMTEYRLLREELDLKKKAEAIAQIEAEYELELKENENILLRKEAEFSESKLETARKQGVLLALVLLMSIVAIVLLTSRFNTRQKHVRQLESVNKRLSELNLEMESILQVVSHDFRTPLAKIKMLSELISSNEGAQLTENSREKLGRIGSSVDEAEDLVSDILEIKNFYKDGNYVPDPIAFSIEEEVQFIIEQYEVPIGLKELKLSYSHSGEATIIQEKDVLKRVIGNLLSNAVKFVEHGKNIWITSQNANGELVVRVKDNGPGFSNTDKEKMFRKFAEFSNKPIGWGTSHGLGLYIVKKLVDRIGGTIDLVSEPGEGSEFIVRIPSEVA
ncbi:MAG: tetratricopeptide repeat-containing sensor histidine kinase [Bacteroidia bacterium]|nr:tetratricopeptide repeat-containing sensor histidine kinase [Bacteroidia bacterium]